MGKLFIIRHGQTSLNGESGASTDKIRGWTDVPLNKAGKTEASAAADKLADKNITELHSSDLQRAKNTASAIGSKIGVTPKDSQDFRPWNLGDLQGTSSKDAQPQLQSSVVNTPDKPVTGGESFNSFKSRALPAMSDLIKKAHDSDKNIAVTTHYRNIALLHSALEDGKGSTDFTNPKNQDIKPSAFLEKHSSKPGDVFCIDCADKHLPGGMTKLK